MRGLSLYRSAAKPRQNPHAPPAIAGLFEQNASSTHRETVVLGAKLKCGPRLLLRQDERIGRAAELPNGTSLAFRTRSADECAQFHQSRVIFAGLAPRQKFGGMKPELFSSSACIDRRLEIEESRQDARDVGLDDRDGLIEGERRDGVRGVATDAGQFANRIQKTAAMFLRDDDRRRPQISRARIIAEALPRMKDVIFGSRRESRDSGKPPEPFIIIRDHAGNLGLLKHDLGDENGVRIAGATPGKIPSVFSVPGKKRAAERRIRFDAENVGRLAR